MYCTYYKQVKFFFAPEWDENNRNWKYKVEGIDLEDAYRLAPSGPNLLEPQASSLF